MTRTNSDSYAQVYQRSLTEPEAFWAEQAEEIPWIKTPTKVLDKDQNEVCGNITNWLAGNPSAGTITGRPGAEVHPLVFVFTGQGAQWWRMGQDLLEREPVFKAVLEVFIKVI